MRIRFFLIASDVKETEGQEEFPLTTIIHFEHCYKNKKTTAVRSRISSKRIFARCVGYFNRAYYGFYVTSCRILALFFLPSDNVSYMIRSDLSRIPCGTPVFSMLSLWDVGP